MLGAAQARFRASNFQQWWLRSSACTKRSISDAPAALGHELSTHVSSDGSTPMMVDVGHKVSQARLVKLLHAAQLQTSSTERVQYASSLVLCVQAVTKRTATARTRVKLPPEIVQKLTVVGGDVVGKKGPIFTTAIVAGVLGAKQTSTLIPFCHPLPIEDCKVDVNLLESNTIIQVSAAIMLRANATACTATQCTPLLGYILLCCKSVTVLNL